MSARLAELLRLLLVGEVDTAQLVDQLVTQDQWHDLAVEALALCAALLEVNHDPGATLAWLTQMKQKELTND